MQAKDLTKEYPRSPYDTSVGGYPWLARMIDKVRALKAGTLGEYTPYPCGGDRNFLGHLGVDPDALKAVIDGGADDAAIAAWVKANAPAGHEAKLQAYVAASHQGYPAGSDMQGYLEGALQELKAARPELDFSSVINFAQMICVEEGHPIPVAAG